MRKSEYYSPNVILLVFVCWKTMFGIQKGGHSLFYFDYADDIDVKITIPEQMQKSDLSSNED